MNSKKTLEQKFSSFGFSLYAKSIDIGELHRDDFFIYDPERGSCTEFHPHGKIIFDDLNISKKDVVFYLVSKDDNNIYCWVKNNQLFELVEKKEE